MKAIRVKYGVLSPRRVRGRAVNAVFAVVKVDEQWNIVHRRTGVATYYQHPHSQRQVVEMARAATKKFAKQLDYQDASLLIKALRQAGSVAWSRRWWQKRANRT